MNQPKKRRATVHQLCKVLYRAMTTDKCPGRELLFAVISTAVKDAMSRSREQSRARRWICEDFHPEFGLYCGLFGLNPDYARELLTDHYFAHVGETPEPEKKRRGRPPRVSALEVSP